jgi:hypothetical protein
MKTRWTECVARVARGKWEDSEALTEDNLSGVLGWLNSRSWGAFAIIAPALKSLGKNVYPQITQIMWLGTLVESCYISTPATLDSSRT